MVADSGIALAVLVDELAPKVVAKSNQTSPTGDSSRAYFE